jgi:hypothetical protein
MPMYSYRNLETGDTREEYRPVEERDRLPVVPGNWQRVTVPNRIGVVGLRSNPHEQGTQMRRAYYDKECQGTLEKEFTPQDIKDAQKAWPQ